MLMDSYAWIEFFRGSEKGEEVGSYFTNKEIFTSIFSEITEWCLKNDLNPEEYVSLIERYSQILELSKEVSELAGKINFEHKKKIKSWGMLDSFIYASALFYNLTVITGDKHFIGLKNVQMI